jgi:hypothetical protein
MVTLKVSCPSLEINIAWTRHDSTTALSSCLGLLRALSALSGVVPVVAVFDYPAMVQT